MSQLTNWYKLTPEAVLEVLHSKTQGLSLGEIESRLAQYGPNKLMEKKVDSYFIIFLKQFLNPLIYVLLIAVFVMMFLGEYIDSIVVAIVLVLNAVIGAFQEGKAQNTLNALKKMQPIESVVRRGGQEQIIPAENLVPGDIVIINDGDQVPADCRILEATNLLVDESALTGESTPVDKNSQLLLKDKVQIADMSNMIFKGTFIVRGLAQAIVVTTGINTEVGKISQELSSLSNSMPLKDKIDKLTKFIIGIAAVVIGLFFAIGIFYGYGLSEMFLVAVAVAVSVIPEGLPIVITLVLASGVWRMSKKNALVKKLQAVEALGQATIIAVDKTGTITKNELMVSSVYVDGAEYQVTGDGYNREGGVVFENGSLEEKNITLLAQIAIYCASAKTVFIEDKKIWRVTGDPTEASLLVFGEKLGFKKDIIEKTDPLVSEIPFSSDLKYHATLHKNKEANFVTVVGAPEVVIAKISFLNKSGSVVPITDQDREFLSEKVVQMSARGLRVLAASYNGQAESVLQEDVLPPLTFAGFFGLQDVVRLEVKEAIKLAQKSNIKVVMITGDHRVTAEAIATSVGIFRTGDTVVEGVQLEDLSREELKKIVATATVFARVSPKHKLSIIEAFRARGEVVAMTGDGVNDALSLVAADLGVAMGQIGTEVAKEAADIILLDDNFSSIIAAVEEGRSIYRTIKKTIVYLLSTGIGEMLAIGGAVILGWPLPLLATQIIWLNFVTDGFLVVAFAAEPKDSDILSDSFTNKDASFITPASVVRMFLMGGVMMAGTLFLFSKYINLGIAGDLSNEVLVKAWTISLTTLAVFQWFNVWNCRSDKKSIFAQNPFSNLYLVLATMVVILLHMAIIYLPFLQNIFKTTALSLNEWGLIIVVASSILVVEEIRKLIVRSIKK